MPQQREVLNSIVNTNKNDNGISQQQGVRALGIQSRLRPVLDKKQKNADATPISYNNKHARYGFFSKVSDKGSRCSYPPLERKQFSALKRHFFYPSAL